MRAPITAIAREQEHRSDATTVTPSANRYLSAPGGHMVFLSDADHKWNDFRLWFIADASWVCNKNDIDTKSTSESKDPWKPWHGPGVSYVVPLVFGRCHNGDPVAHRHSGFHDEPGWWHVISGGDHLNENTDVQMEAKIGFRLDH